MEFTGSLSSSTSSLQDSGSIPNEEKKLEEEVHKIISEIIPEKILKLSSLVSKLNKWIYEDSGNSTTHESNQTGTTSDEKLESSITSHEGRVKILLDELNQLLQHTEALKVYMTLKLPALQDQHHFNVKVQSQMIGELGIARASMRVMIDKALSYHPEERAEILKQIKKYPHVKDYQENLRWCEDTAKVVWYRWMGDLNHLYMLLDEIIRKNNDSLSLKRTPPTSRRNRRSSGGALRRSSSSHFSFVI